MLIKRIASVVGATALAATALFATAQQAAADDIQPFIVGGSPVSTAPSWTAVIGNGSRMFCSAVLVNKDWVMTAEHCSGATQVRLGSLNTNSGGTIVQLSRSVASPSNDIRLYKLAQSTTRAPLAMAQSTPSIGVSVTLYGYGQTCAPKGCGGMSPVLKSVGTKLVADSQCGGIEGASELCFDTKETATDCYGDSGGPALANGVLIGVTSRGADGPGASTCGKTNSIYGDVASVRSWVSKTIGG